MLQNQEAKTMKHIGSLIFDSPLQNGYEEGAEVRSLFPNERIENREGHTVVADLGVYGNRHI